MLKHPEIKRYFLMLTLLFTFGIVSGVQFATVFETEAQQVLTELASGFEPLLQSTALELTIAVFVNNALLAFIALFGGLLFGIFPFFFILANGYVVGVIGQVISKGEGISSFLSGVVPHGIIEIPAVLLAASGGIWLGTKFTRTIRQKAPIKPHLREAWTSFYRIILPLLLVSAIIEGFTTPKIIQLFVY